MALLQLEVRGLRNLSLVSFTPSRGLNLLYGANGSGKTSLLEAIYLLGMGRSFRSPQLRKYLQHGAPSLTIFGRVENSSGLHSIGLQKQPGDITLIQCNGQRQESASILANILPLQLITPESHNLLSGEPRERRSYLDWGLFHVEHHFLDLSKTFKRLLEQRNAALRNQRSDREIAAWETALSESGEELSLLRKRYLMDIEPLFQQIYAELLQQSAPRLMYRQGWSKELGLLEVMQRNRATERTGGYTMAGPHRGDFRFMNADGLDAVDSFSRGQQKLAAYALRLAQMHHLDRVRQRRCTLLIDDLAAELDGERRQLVFSQIASLSAQCLITATERSGFDMSEWKEVSTFHVEHGSIKEVI